MSQQVMATQQFHSVLSAARFSSAIRHRRCSVMGAPSSENFAMFSSNPKPPSSGLLKFPGIGWRCNSSGDSDTGENEFRIVLDAFFLGKAVGETLTEHIESSVGEFLSVIGRLQAEQQKQILQFQEEVLEKARRAKEQALREAIEALFSKSASLGVSAVKGVAETASSVTDSAMSAVEGVAGTASSVTDSAISAVEGFAGTTSSVTDSAISAVEGVAGTASSGTESIISAAGSSVVPKPSDRDSFLGLFDKD